MQNTKKTIQITKKNKKTKTYIAKYQKNYSNNPQKPKKPNIWETTARGSPGSQIFGFFAYLNAFFGMLHIYEPKLTHLQCFFGISHIYVAKVTYSHMFFGILHHVYRKYQKTYANMLLC